MRITVKQLPRPGHEILLPQALKQTEQILVSDIKNLSYESAYRLMYAFVQKDSTSNALIAVNHLNQCFRKGKWNGVQNWQALQDSWLYLIRASIHGLKAKQTFENIFATIECYPKLLDDIFLQRPEIPRDIRNLIRKLVLC